MSLPARHRRLLLLGVAASLALPALASSRRVLQPMTEGPFYPPRAWRQRWADWDADLTRVVQDGQTSPPRANTWDWPPRWPMRGAG